MERATREGQQVLNRAACMFVGETYPLCHQELEENKHELMMRQVSCLQPQLVF